MSNIESPKPNFVPFDQTQDVSNIKRVGLHLNLLGTHTVMPIAKRSIAISLLHGISKASFFINEWAEKKFGLFRYELKSETTQTSLVGPGTQPKASTPAPVKNLPERSLEIHKTLDLAFAFPQIVRETESNNINIYCNNKSDKITFQHNQTNNSYWYEGYAVNEGEITLLANDQEFLSNKSSVDLCRVLGYGLSMPLATDTSSPTERKTKRYGLKVTSDELQQVQAIPKTTLQADKDTNSIAPREAEQPPKTDVNATVNNLSRLDTKINKFEHPSTSQRPETHTVSPPGPRVDDARNPINTLAFSAIQGIPPGKRLVSIDDEYDYYNCSKQVVDYNYVESPVTIYFPVATFSPHRPQRQFNPILNTPGFYSDNNKDLFTKDQILEIANSDTIFDHAYTESPQINTKPPEVNLENYSESLTPENVWKNRYGNVLSHNDHRVKDENSPKWFINATYMDIDQKYIATQGPLPNEKATQKHGPLPQTVSDFYYMLFLTNPQNMGEQTVVTVVNPEEFTVDKQGKKVSVAKCEAWWPTTEEPSKPYGNYTATLVKSKQGPNDSTGAHLVTRTIEIKNTNTQETRTITQQHIENWPDHGVVDSALLDEVLAAMPSDPESPTIIHCSAGIGRTGIVSLTHMLRPQITADTPASEIQNLVYHTLIEMRKKRPGMIQSREQYEFVLRNLFQYQNRLKQTTKTVS